MQKRLLFKIDYVCKIPPRGGAGSFLAYSLNGADAFSILLNNLQSGQTLARNVLTNNGQDNSQQELEMPVLIKNSNLINQIALSLNQLPAATANSHSWRDPQIF